MEAQPVYNLYCYRTKEGVYHGYVSTRDRSSDGTVDKMLIANVPGIPPRNRNIRFVYAILNAGSLEHAYDNNLIIDEPLVLTTKKPRHPKGDVKALYDFDMNWHFN